MTRESSVWAAAWKAAKSHNKKEQTLYTAPPLRDLSDDELFEAAFNFDCGERRENDNWNLRGVGELRELANNILAKAREKV